MNSDTIRYAQANPTSFLNKHKSNKINSETTGNFK